MGKENYKMSLVTSAIGQGLLWGILALGLFLTFRILNFPDMTVEGTFHLVQLYVYQLWFMELIQLSQLHYLWRRIINRIDDRSTLYKG